MIRRVPLYPVTLILMSLLLGAVLTTSSDHAHALSLTSLESQIYGIVNGTSAYNYDLALEKIALNHSLSNYSYRSAGSSGANATADWITEQFNGFGLETQKESFSFTNWDVLSKPALIIDIDGYSNTTEDQAAINSFQATHYSWPTPQNGSFADLVILPLPLAASRDEIGTIPINTTEWNAIEITDKILLIGREVRWDYSWEETYTNKLTAQTPKAVIYTWWYDWMSFTPPVFFSAGGRPGRAFGSYYWDLEIPVGFVNYEDGSWIRNLEESLDVSAKAKIESVIGYGPHYNVVGKLAGTRYPHKQVIVIGHYDTVMCSGFADNGAGTAGVIELARVFSEANKTGLLRPRYSILFIAVASEEIGLVGSTYYVLQHKSELSDVVAVINLDGIGSDDLYVSKTDPGIRFDLDELVFEAAEDLGINAMSSGTYQGSDDAPFKDPPWSDWLVSFFWGFAPGIADATPVSSCIAFISHPLVYREKWTIGTPGWIHTSYDNSTSTATLNWIETEDLEDHLRVAALSLARIVHLKGDIDGDGDVDIFDIVVIADAYGSKEGDPEYNPSCDLDGDGDIDIFDIVIACGHYGESW